MYANGHIVTTEGLDFSLALKYYCRARFVQNLLPLLQNATSLRRVVSVAAGSREGPVDASDLSSAKTLSNLGRRAHFTSFITLSHAVFAKTAPQVTFVHDYPGAVKTGIFRGSTGVVMLLVRAALAVIGPFIYIPSEESGERHLFLATSAAFPAAASGSGDDAAAGVDMETASGIPLPDGVRIAKGIDGKLGSGVYSIDQSCESASPAVEELLATMERGGVRDQVWQHTEEVFERVTREDGGS